MKIIMNDNFTKFKKSAGLFIKTGIISLFVGIICGIVGVAFHLAVDFVTEFQGRKSMGVVHTACFRRCNCIYVCKV